jgi:hypothetical protein
VRPHVEVVADQLPPTRDGWLRIAVQALVDCDAGFETFRRKPPLDSAMRELLDERSAVGPSVIADWALLLAVMTRPATSGTKALASSAAVFFI